MSRFVWRENSAMQTARRQHFFDSRNLIRGLASEQPLLSFSRRFRVTVCIAALCQWENNQMIVGASDRMITAGDIEFQPPQQKVLRQLKFYIFRCNHSV